MSRFAIAILFLMAIVLSSAVAEGQQYTYTVENGAVTITDYSGLNCDVTIPSSIDGMPVVGVEYLGSSNGLVRVVIPASITYFNCAAFPSGPNLTDFYFLGDAPSCGNSVFGGDNSAKVYYNSGAKGWGVTFGGLTTIAIGKACGNVNVAIDKSWLGTATGGGTYSLGSSHKISAGTYEGMGFKFVGWSDGSLKNPRTVKVTPGATTYTAYVASIYQPDCVTFSETYRDNVVRKADKSYVEYPSGSAVIKATVLNGFGNMASQCNKQSTLSVLFIWEKDYSTSSNHIWWWPGNYVLGDDPKYKDGDQTARIPITYMDEKGKKRLAGSANVTFEANSVNIAIIFKAGQDAKQNNISDFIYATMLTGNAEPGKSVAVRGCNVRAVISIANMYESFSKLIVAGTDTTKSVKKGNQTYTLDTLKITGFSHY